MKLTQAKVQGTGANSGKKLKVQKLTQAQKIKVQELTQAKVHVQKL
ncbi:hypothetical protein JNG57_04240 [Mycoplasmopsis bovis]|nr:hypothetical protein [Mycoplasmopsis bovis]UCP05068.1 hypothetical protein JNG57_04240 [Mycoplasmopsis bovis]